MSSATYCLPYPASAPCPGSGASGPMCSVASTPGAELCTLGNTFVSSLSDAQVLAGAFITVLSLAVLFRFVLRFFLNSRG